MATHSKIQWCDDTVNPVMGCDGCELWPKRSRVIAEIARLLAEHTGFDESMIRHDVGAIADQFADEPMKDLIFATVQYIASCHEAMFTRRDVKRIVSGAKSILTCYAGVLTENRAGKLTGYPGASTSRCPFLGAWPWRPRAQISAG